MASFDYDVVLVGSGFGGSVAALRAAEKGYRVGVLESGPRWPDEKFPKSQKPRRQPVALDNRARRTRNLAVAEHRRPGHQAAPRVRLRTHRPDHAAAADRARGRRGRTPARRDQGTSQFVVPYYLDDRKLRVSVARVADHLYAVDDLCPCADQACPLSGGLLTGTTIMCQCHGSRFNVVSGAVLNGPATDALNTYEARAVDGSVQIRV